MILDEPGSVAWDKLVVAEEFLQSGGEGKQPLRKTVNMEWNPLLVYQTKDGSDLRL